MAAFKFPRVFATQWNVASRPSGFSQFCRKTAGSNSIAIGNRGDFRHISRVSYLPFNLGFLAQAARANIFQARTFTAAPLQHLDSNKEEPVRCSDDKPQVRQPTDSIDKLDDLAKEANKNWRKTTEERKRAIIAVFMSNVQAHDDSLAELKYRLLKFQWQNDALQNLGSVLRPKYKTETELFKEQVRDFSVAAVMVTSVVWFVVWMCGGFEKKKETPEGGVGKANKEESQRLDWRRLLWKFDWRRLIWKLDDDEKSEHSTPAGGKVQIRTPKRPAPAKVLTKIKSTNSD